MTRSTRRRRGRFSTVAHIAVSFLVAACAGGDAAGERAGAKADSTFRVALLTPGPISDQSWNGGAYQGLMAIRDSLGATISHIQTKTPAEFEENFRQYGTQGYDLVFGHGFEFQDAAVRVAPAFPQTLYVTTSGNRVADNVAGMEFAFDEPSYVAGIMAAGLTKSGTIGVIGGTELPPVKKSFDAFAAGARSVRPDIRVLSSYIGNWDDVGAGKEQALAQIGQGADVIFQNADAAGLGVFQAARESGRALVIGSNGNQNAVAPDVTVASVVIDLPRAFLVLGREVRQGGFTPRVVALGEQEGVTYLALNDALASRIPPAVRARMDSVTAAMKAGTFPRPGA